MTAVLNIGAGLAKCGMSAPVIKHKKKPDKNVSSQRKKCNMVHSNLSVIRQTERNT